MILKVKALFVGDTDNTFIQFFRYLFVGGFAFVVDFGVMTLLKECFGLDPVVSATISFILGLAVNYILSTFWIFRNSKIKNKIAEFAGFAMIGVIGLGINDLIISFFQNFLGYHMVFGGLLPADKYYMLGKIVSTVVVFIWNFFARKILLFSKSKNSNNKSQEA